MLKLRVKCQIHSQFDEAKEMRSVQSLFVKEKQESKQEVLRNKSDFSLSEVIIN